MKKIHILIVEARFYRDIADALLAGAERALKKADASFEIVSVPGALEIPGAIGFAADAGKGFDGYLALGCVIRGETTHYDLVAGESARGLMTLTIDRRLAIGNGILTVENDDQAWARARMEEKDKGGEAARTCLRMIELQRNWKAG